MNIMNMLKTNGNDRKPQQKNRIYKDESKWPFQNENLQYLKLK